MPTRPRALCLYRTLLVAGRGEVCGSGLASRLMVLLGRWFSSDVVQIITRRLNRLPKPKSPRRHRCRAKAWQNVVGPKASRDMSWYCCCTAAAPTPTWSQESARLGRSHLRNPFRGHLVCIGTQKPASAIGLALVWLRG